ncbi:MAG TPA: SWIB/MDM2 domain-containing protein [bacterium]|jgi:chromatin remodeling complex protein RSC6|nr:SWIB/MDM2 domain-containing protein [bacterium]
MAKKVVKKAATKAAPKKVVKKVAKKAAPKKVVKKVVKKVKRAPNPEFMKPVQPDAVLGALVGSKPLPRTQITKKLWEYIKKNNLQDPKNKRMINADDKLKPFFGGKKQASMFELGKYIKAHTV